MGAGIMNIEDDVLAKLLKQIANVDKTPEYEYWSSAVNMEKYLTANGDPPKTGHCWCTPREICNQYLRDIESGTLADSLKRLME
jgi:hypothetical protein